MRKLAGREAFPRQDFGIGAAISRGVLSASRPARQQRQGIHRPGAGPVDRYSLRATDLSCRLRQSQRLAASIPVELRCEEPGGAWEEETQTKQISRYGALLKCQHPVRAGEILLVVRLDTGRQAQARVARRQRKIGGVQEIGIEFLDRDNFWNMDWSSVV